MRKPPTPTIVTMAVFTTITVVLWIFVSVYNILIKKADVEISEKLLAPVDASLNVEELQKTSERKYFEEGQEKPFNIEPQFIPLTIPEQPQATSSAQ